MAENTVDKSNVPAQTEKTEVPATRESGRYLVPAVDIYEEDEGLTLVADLPGVDKKGLEIHVADGLLTIEGRIGHPERANPAYEEYELLEYFRQFRLGDAVDTEAISAELAHGVLTLRLPKAEKAKPRRIDVNVG